MEVEVEQNTSYWEKLLRPGFNGIRLGSSDAAVAIGVSKYTKPMALYQYIVEHKREQLVKMEENEAKEFGPKEFGKIGEPIVIDYYKMITGFEVEKGNFWKHEKYPLYYGASPDARVFLDGKMIGILEVKTCFYRLYDTIPREHVAQTMFQLWVTGKPWCDYMACLLNHDNPNETNPPNIILRVFPDPRYISWMAQRLLRFSKCLELKTPRDFMNMTAEEEGDPPPNVEFYSPLETFHDWGA